MFGMDPEELFNEQFEPHEGGFLYRRARSGPPIPVSAEERDRFVATYKRRTKCAKWLSLAAVIALIGFCVWYGKSTGTDLGNTAVVGSVVLVFGLIMIGQFWAYNYPVRELRDRAPIGGPPSTQESTRQHFATWTYPRIASIGLGGALLIASRVKWRQDLYSGRNLYFLVIAALLVTMSIIFAIRKWRFEATDQ
jgi:hypothetical protein